MHRSFLLTCYEETLTKTTMHDIIQNRTLTIGLVIRYVNKCLHMNSLYAQIEYICSFTLALAYTCFCSQQVYLFSVIATLNHNCYNTPLRSTSQVESVLSLSQPQYPIHPLSVFACCTNN